jgi:hypothetical protein
MHLRVQRRLQPLRGRLRPVHDGSQLWQLRKGMLGRCAGLRRGGGRVFLRLGVSHGRAHPVQRQLRRYDERCEQLQRVRPRVLDGGRQRRGRVRQRCVRIRVQRWLHALQWYVCPARELVQLRELR